MQDFLKGGSNLGLHAKGGRPGGLVLGPMLKSLHPGPNAGGGGCPDPRTPPGSVPVLYEGYTSAMSHGHLNLESQAHVLCSSR